MSASAESSEKFLLKGNQYLLVQSQQCAPEQYMKYVQSKQKRHQKGLSSVVLVFLMLILDIFHTLLCCFYC